VLEKYIIWWSQGQSLVPNCAKSVIGNDSTSPFSVRFDVI